LYDKNKHSEACEDLKKAADMGYEDAKKKQEEVCPMN
jgi:hypothetical protein